MSRERIRFIHTADLHLERPLYGLMEIPDHLRDLLIDAPYIAARQVFEAAVLEQVDFVVIAGDVADITRAGPRAIAFLEEQFQLLQERQIRVYWVGGEVDVTDTWTRHLQVPANVHFFAGGEVEEVVHLRQDTPLVSILGSSWSGSSRVAVSRYQTPSSELPQIAVGYGMPDSDPAKETASESSDNSILYWALGGAHQRRQKAGSSAVHAGTPQGRCPLETGAHGCCLVEINQDHEVRTKVLTTDCVRFETLDLSITTATDQSQFEERVAELVDEARRDAGPRPLLATCRVFGFEQVKCDVPPPVLGQQLTRTLNERLGKADPAVWTLQLEIEPPDELPDQWYQEATILGDFLRSVRDDDDDDETLNDLERYLSERQRTGRLASAICLDEESTRSRVLRKSALLGSELLRGKRTIDLKAVSKPEEYVL